MHVDNEVSECKLIEMFYAEPCLSKNHHLEWAPGVGEARKATLVYDDTPITRDLDIEEIEW